MTPSTDGIVDKVAVLTSADSVPMGDFDAPHVSLNTSKRIETIPMKQWQGLIEVGIDQLKNGSMSEGEYFLQQAEGIIRSTGGDLSLTIYKAMRDFAVASHNSGLATGQVINAGGNANTNFSITAVKWVQSDTSGLYNASGWGNGKVFDVEAVAGGNTYLNQANQAIKGRIMKLQLGLRMVNPRHVASLVNIDKAANLATLKIVDKISELIEMARYADALYMHPTLKRLIGNQIKFEKMELTVADRNINTIVDAIDNVPIITDFNLAKGTEANITVQA